MATDVIMPQMGESIFEGTITKWLKKLGDPVEKDEPLFEISTDKVDAEIPSPIAGTLSEIKFPEGATVQVNTVVAVLVDKASSVAAPDSQGGLTRPLTATTQAPEAQLAPPQVATEIVMPQMANRSSKEPLPSGSRRPAIRSRKTSRSSRSRPTRSMQKFLHPSMVCSPRSKSRKAPQCK